MKTPLQKLNRPLLAWYDENRRHLPWREEISPYRTWISEIMLQQTRVGTVIPYFERFMARYPTVSALSAADTGELLKCWEGLGYYSRARNLQKTAQKIEADFDGRFPQTYEELMTLPGIGDYTAGAILSIAFGQKIPAVDGNVLRVVSRLTDSHADVLDGKVRGAVRAQVAQAMPPDRPGAYNQALMDLGATVCLPSGTPVCEACPANKFCTGFLAGEAEKLPVRAKKPPKRVEKMTVFVLRQAGRVALTRRSDTGLLASLWEYPHLPGTLDESAAAAAAASWGLEIRTWHRQLTARHEFTHIRWEMTGYLLDVDGRGGDNWRWASVQDRQGMAIPSAFSKFTAEVDKREEEN